ncbi:MAG: hypothetical protein OTJ98_09365 [Dehalococcoidia bacterium]|nr:hypothetical protein [Dehalococcoidia bacterium]
MGATYAGTYNGRSHTGLAFNYKTLDNMELAAKHHEIADVMYPL